MTVDKRDNATEDEDMLGDVAQLGLFGGEEKVAKKKKPVEKMAVSKAEYYLSMSSLQKYIRRGMADDAVDAARVVFSFNRSALRKRLMVIAMEDIGLGDLEVLRGALERLAATRAPWEEFDEVTRLLAGSTKCRDADDGFNMVIWAREGRQSRIDIPDRKEFDFLVENANYMGEHPERDKMFWDWALHEAGKRGPNCLDIVEFLKPFQKLASWHANHIVLLLLYRWDDKLDKLRLPTGRIKNLSVRDEPVMKRLADDQPICLLGMDGHTHQGKMSLSKVGKKHGLEMFDMHCYEFFSRGGTLDERIHWENDYRTLVLGFLYGPKADRDPRLTEANADLDGFRSWAWRKLVVPQIEKHRASLRTEE